MGGYFVVKSAEGLYYTGCGWTADRDNARAFRGADPWKDAKAVCDHLSADGLRYRVAYVPRQSTSTSRTSPVTS